MVVHVLMAQFPIMNALYMGNNTGLGACINNETSVWVLW